MIFYFSGTGNSKWVADTIAAYVGEHTLSMTEAIHGRDFIFELSDDEIVGFVFPVHAWGLPLIVNRFISQMKIANYGSQYVFFVMTCGDDTGKAPELFADALKKRGLQCNGGFSIQMPNTYILLPGFDIDPKGVQKVKLARGSERIKEISAWIKGRKNLFSCHEGRFPSLKSHIFRPLFFKYMIGDKPFHIEGKCNACRVCEHACPVSNIHLKGGGPVWLGHCIMCLACIHKCPLGIIQYGNRTQSKGRYFLNYKECIK